VAGGLFGRPLFCFLCSVSVSVLDVEDFAVDDAGLLADLGVDGVGEVLLGFGAVFDE